MRLSRGEKIFSVINYLFLSLLALSTIYPFIYVFSASISKAQYVLRGDVVLLPKGITWESYRTVLAEKGLWIAYANTIFYTVAGTLVNLLFTMMGAYPLSKKRLMGRTAIGFFIAFTMMFSAGMIPTYLNLKDLGLLNSRTGFLLAFAISTMNVIILRTFMQAIPEELEESAKVDGASDWRILWSIYLPLSKPALATIGLFYAVGHWNSYFWAMVLLKAESKMPLQVLLKKLVVQMEVSDEIKNLSDLSVTAQETVIYATIIVATLPILIVYPFIQKFFVKGVMIGSLKG